MIERVREADGDEGLGRVAKPLRKKKKIKPFGFIV